MKPESAAPVAPPLLPSLRQVLLGSVAEHMVRHAPCPVPVVRARRGEST